MANASDQKAGAQRSQSPYFAYGQAVITSKQAFKPLAVWSTLYSQMHYPDHGLCVASLYLSWQIEMTKAIPNDALAMQR